MDSNSSGTLDSQNMPQNIDNNRIANAQSMQPGMEGNFSSNNLNGQMNPNMQANSMGPNPGNMGQPYPQPMMRPPKQPMDPAKKKRVVLVVSLVSGLVVVGVALAIILPIVFRVNYSTAYRAAKELQPKIYDIYHGYDCENVIDSVDSYFTSVKRYNEYVDNCKKVYDPETNDLVNKLENTDGVKRNDAIRAQFGVFKNEYMALPAGNVEELNSKLGLWQAMHTFVVEEEELNYQSSDAEFTSAANNLINSGSDVLKTYGEGWLERQLGVAAAYRAHFGSSWSDIATYQASSDNFNNKKIEFKDWEAANKPDINVVAPLSFDDTSKMYSEFDNLYNLISDTYELNYDENSGDCEELFGIIYCE